MSIKDLKNLSSSMSVLYVEDDNEISNMFISYLKKFFKDVAYSKNGLEGLESYKQKSFDLVITDIQMPFMDGFEMSEKIKQINSEQNIIIISAFSDLKNLKNSIKIGIDGYILKPIDFEELNNVLLKILVKIKKFKEHRIYEERLEDLVGKKSEEIIQLKDEKIENYQKVLFALIDLIESRDIYTGKHSLRVANYSKLIAKQMGFSSQECEEIYNAGILHDIGKVSIPDTLLLKPSNLNDDEYNLIKLHVDIGFQVLSKIPMFEKISHFINTHHERVDGTGYPNGLKDEKIPIAGNILAVADVFDAITTSRIYKKRREVSTALAEIESLSGKHFKKQIVDAALVALKDMKIDSSINQLPVTNLEKERFSYFYKDRLTNFYNESYLDIILNKNIHKKEFEYLNMVFLHNFGEYNKKYGWAKGDELLRNISDVFIKSFPETVSFRVHGDDFVLLSSQKDLISGENILQLGELLKDTQVEFELKTYNIFDNDLSSYEKLQRFI